MASNKMSIEWHKGCLVNSRITAENMRKSLEAAQRDLDKITADNLFYAKQIEAAEEQRKMEFDCERFMVKREKKNG